ncbi:MAG: hypothetical protein ABSA05_06790 [Opitutaceae bacterium]|jgi:hypothetical protein
MSTIFALPKKAASIEASLRAWAIADAMRAMGEWDRAGITAHYWQKDIRELAAETASICVAELESDKMQLRLFGKDPGAKETWRLAQGIELVRELAAKMGWRISFERDPGNACRCIID